MMAAMSLIKRMARVMLGAAGFASWFAMPFFAMLAGSLPVKRESKNRTAIRKADQSVIEAYSKLPLNFEARPNNPTAKVVSRVNGYIFICHQPKQSFSCRPERA